MNNKDELWWELNNHNNTKQYHTKKKDNNTKQYHTKKIWRDLNIAEIYSCAGTILLEQSKQYYEHNIGGQTDVNHVNFFYAGVNLVCPKKWHQRIEPGRGGT